MMRNEEDVQRIHQDDENAEKQRQPAQFRKKRRAFLHEESFMDERLQVISSAQQFEGRVFSVRSDRLRFDDGAVHGVDVVEHGASYGIIATTADGRIVLVRQYRHPMNASLWEIPAGTAEGAESIVDGALRELREETGYRAGAARAVASLATSPGFCTEVMHFVYASELQPGDQHLDPDERITVASFSADEAQNLMDTGQIADLKTAFAILWLQQHRGELVRGRADN